MLLNLLWVTGARVSDVVRIKSQDVDTHNQIIYIYVKKRKNNRYPISIDSDVSLMIMNYLSRWNLSGYLIPNVNDYSKPLDRKSVDHKLKVLCEYAGLRKIHAHEFRHGLAMYLLNQGVPMEVISWRLKHSSTKTTMGIYARITPDVERNLIKDRISSYLG
jgi:integrase/recombinase XerD